MTQRFEHEPIPLEGYSTPLPPRPLYFEPDDDWVKVCPACARGGVCGCICNLPEIT